MVKGGSLRPGIVAGGSTWTAYFHTLCDSGCTGIAGVFYVPHRLNVSGGGHLNGDGLWRTRRKKACRSTCTNILTLFSLILLIINIKCQLSVPS